jgi:hypothetical protein
MAVEYTRAPVVPFRRTINVSVTVLPVVIVPKLLLAGYAPCGLTLAENKASPLLVSVTALLPEPAAYEGRKLALNKQSAQRVELGDSGIRAEHICIARAVHDDAARQACSHRKK